MAKGFKQEKKKINGVEYTFQKLPVKQAIDLRSSFLNFSTGEIDIDKLYSAMMTHIIVNPKVTFEDFDEIWEVDELVGEAMEFQYGKKKN